jgi:Cu2+-exporting ATPase
VSQGQGIPAGSFNAGSTAFHVRSSMNFADSPLVSLLRQPAPREGKASRSQQLWTGVAKRWVVTVVGISALGLLLWLPRGVDQALNVAVALLVITCPCAIGIAIPLAYEMTQSKLRRAGFYVRSLDLLDRLTQVKQVLFDKTGTLTLGRLELAEVPPLEPVTRDVAWNLAVRSSHPVASAVVRTWEAAARYDVTAAIEELPGRGMQWQRADGLWRLGRSDWALTVPLPERLTVLSRDGALVARLPTREALRADSAAEVQRLTTAGYDVWLLSGDTQANVDVLAKTLGLAADHGRGALKPEDKAAEVRRIGASSALYLGDGVNDALAFEAALAAGTPAIDRPVMPSRSDFFLVGDGLASLHDALARSLHLRVVVKRVLTISVIYNVAAITASLLGFMSPLAAAVSMPLSTLSLLLITITQLKTFENARSASTQHVTQNSTLRLAPESPR